MTNYYKLLKKLKHDVNKPIFVWTGYKFEEIMESYPMQKCLIYIDYLIDGEYIEGRNNDCILRGSDNQIIHILDPNYKEKYEEYLLQSTNQIQNFMTSDGVISVGIHKPNFMNKLQKAVSGKGLV